MKDENPLDLEQHEDETFWDVWKRRLVFGLVILLCVTFAAPTFSSCSSAFESGDRIATYRLGGETREIGDLHYRDVQRRLYQTYVALFQQAPQDEDAYWRHLLLDAVARDHGVHVSDATAMEFIAGLPAFQLGGQFDEAQYLATISGRTQDQLTHKDLLRTVKEMIRGQEYTRLYLNALSPQKTSDSFDAWQKDNEKLTVEYVVQEFAPVAAEVAAMEPTDAELNTFVSLPMVEARLRLPPRKVVEVAYIRALDLTASQKAELETFLVESERLDPAQPLDVLAKQEYAGAAADVYTQDNWRRSQKRLWEQAKAAQQKQWEADGNEGDLPEDQWPPHPDDTEWPAQALTAYEQFWRDPVERELLGRLFLQVVAERSEREGRSFADLLTDYATYGLQVARNEEPLPDHELIEGLPAELARNSELAMVTRTHLRGPKPGDPFTPQVHVEPVPMTQLASALEDRGYMVVRLAEFEPERPRRVDEARDEIVEMWREHRTQELAKARLERVRDAVTAGATLAAAAAAEGLQVETLRNVNRGTPTRTPPSAAPGQEMDAATAEVARRLRHRNRVLEDYRTLLTTETGQFRVPSNVLTDTRTSASYLIRVVAKEPPSPIEMTEADLRRVQSQQSSVLVERFQGLLGLEALERRFQLRRLEPRPGEGDDADEDRGEDETGSGDDAG